MIRVDMTNQQAAYLRTAIRFVSEIYEQDEEDANPDMLKALEEIAEVIDEQEAKL
jgi:hypothetical protein